LTLFTQIPFEIPVRSTAVLTGLLIKNELIDAFATDCFYFPLLPYFLADPAIVINLVIADTFLFVFRRMNAWIETCCLTEPYPFIVRGHLCGIVLSAEILIALMLQFINTF
tara:strand:+ start:87 stop:419 length:333 start_codon:yes stop_codon:yes gene_type:complete